MQQSCSSSSSANVPTGEGQNKSNSSPARLRRSNVLSPTAASRPAYSKETTFTNPGGDSGYLLLVGEFDRTSPPDLIQQEKEIVGIGGGGVGGGTVAGGEGSGGPPSAVSVLIGGKPLGQFSRTGTLLLESDGWGLIAPAFRVHCSKWGAWSLAFPPNADGTPQPLPTNVTPETDPFFTPQLRTALHILIPDLEEGAVYTKTICNGFKLHIALEDSDAIKQILSGAMALEVSAALGELERWKLAALVSTRATAPGPAAVIGAFCDPEDWELNRCRDEVGALASAVLGLSEEDRAALTRTAKTARRIQVRGEVGRGCLHGGQGEGTGARSVRNGMVFKSTHGPWGLDVSIDGPMSRGDPQIVVIVSFLYVDRTLDSPSSQSSGNFLTNP